MSDLEAVPNPVIHSCQILDPGRDVRRIEIVSEELKRGRQMGYSRSKIVDADRPDRVLALTEGQGVSIGSRPTGWRRWRSSRIDVVDSPDLPPLWQVFGGRRRGDGHWALPELAARSPRPMPRCTSGRSSSSWRRPRSTCAAEVAGTDRLQGVSSHVMFLARGKVGPFRVETEPIAGADGVVAVRTVHARRGCRRPPDHCRVVSASGRACSRPSRPRMMYCEHGRHRQPRTAVHRFWGPRRGRWPATGLRPHRATRATRMQSSWTARRGWRATSTDVDWAVTPSGRNSPGTRWARTCSGSTPTTATNTSRRCSAHSGRGSRRSTSTIGTSRPNCSICSQIPVRRRWSTTPLRAATRRGVARPPTSRCSSRSPTTRATNCSTAQSTTKRPSPRRRRHRRRSTPSPDDLYVLYTGGTTGMPKGVLWRQHDIFMTSFGGRNLSPASRRLVRGDRRGPPRTRGEDHGAAAAHARRRPVGRDDRHHQGKFLVFATVVDRFDADEVVGTIEARRRCVVSVVGDAIARPS